LKSRFPYYRRSGSRFPGRRSWGRSPLGLVSFMGGNSDFTCPMTEQEITKLACFRCKNYVTNGEDGWRECSIMAKSRQRAIEENRRKTEEQIRENEQFAREMEEEKLRLEGRRREIKEESERMQKNESLIKEKTEDSQSRGMEEASEEEEKEMEDEEKQEEDWEEAFREPEEETESADDKEGDDTLQNHDGI
jgi:hypothetical protein